MLQVLVAGLHQTLCLNFGSHETVRIDDVKRRIQDLEGIPTSELRISLNNKPVCDHFQLLPLQNGLFHSLRVSLRLLGGKGGFGALLRGAGGSKTGKKTTQDDCRDLSGRRIRHVKNEQKLAEWYQEQKARQQNGGRIRTEAEEEAERQRKEDEERRIQRKLAQYTTEVHEIQQSVAESVETGVLQAKKLKEAENKKVHTATVKKRKFWEDELFDGALATDDFEVESKQNGNTNGNHVHETIINEDKEGDEEEKEEIPNTAVSPAKSSEPEHQQNGETFDLNKYKNAQELESVGMEILKQELMKRGMLCGGTLQQRAERLFSVKGLLPEQIDSKLLAKSNGNAKKKKQKKSSPGP